MNIFTYHLNSFVDETIGKIMRILEYLIQTLKFQQLFHQELIKVIQHLAKNHHFQLCQKCLQECWYFYCWLIQHLLIEVQDDWWQLNWVILLQNPASFDWIFEWYLSWIASNLVSFQNGGWYVVCFEVFDNLFWIIHNISSPL